MKTCGASAVSLSVNQNIHTYTPTQMCTRVNMTYKPTYFPPPVTDCIPIPALLITFGSGNPVSALRLRCNSHDCIAKHQCSATPLFSPHQPLLFLNITSRGCPDYCCPGNRGAGPKNRRVWRQVEEETSMLGENYYSVSAWSSSGGTSVKS